MEVGSVNLLWQKRFRGLMPVGARSLDPEGNALLVRPDEFETRTYQFLRCSPDGAHQELHLVNVEKLYRFDGLPDGRLVLGTTDDDLYLFREGKKTRFAPDRRAVYSDFCISPETGWFVAGYSTPLFNSHGVAFGDANGRQGWTRDFNSPVNRVAITLDGRVVAAGLQNGRVAVMDNMRTPQWDHEGDSPVTALAMGGSGRAAIAGTESGMVLAFNEDGGIRWEAQMELPVRVLSVDGERTWTAAALSDGTDHRLVVLDSEGQPVWEHSLETSPTGLTLSAAGRHLLVSCSNGLALLFEADFAGAASASLGSRRDRNLTRARGLADEGQLEPALELLTSVLNDRPYDAALAEEAGRIQERLLLVWRTDAARLLAAEQPVEALAVLRRGMELRPWDEGLFAECARARQEGIRLFTERAERFEAGGEWDPAAAAWLQVIDLDPTCGSARQALLRLRERQATELLEEGDRLQAEGRLDQAIQHWQGALELLPTSEAVARLHAAEVERCLQAGIAFYESQRLAEAQFQLKKALALDPGNETAARYLGYCEGRAHDPSIQDRFARLE